MNFPGLLAPILVGACFCAVAWSAKSEAATPAYPAKAIRFIVPYTPGSSAEIFARAIAQKIAVFVKNEAAKWAKAVKISGARPD
jgi:tripartite-type tricarboxylate transporter receptor subunit TctC